MTVALAGMTLHTNNDNETNWAGTDGPDDYNNAIQGSNSESWQVGKNVSETGTLTLSSTLNATRGIFTFWMSSNLAPYYTDIRLELQSSASNYKQFTVATSTNKAIGGNFVALAIDYVNNGTSTGTFVPASFSVSRVIVDNSASGNIRTVVNNWIDAMYYGPGHTISGTTAGDALFAEAAAVDELVANKYGVMWNYNGIIYSQGDIDLTGTALTSENEVLVFVDTTNGYSTYELDISGTVTFVGTGIIGAGTIDFDLDGTAATAFSMTGGFLTACKALTLIAGQTFEGVVVNNNASASIANDPSGCTWNTSGLITLTSTGSLTGCILNEGTASASVSTTALEDLTGNEFISDGSNHAVELTSVGDGSMSWDNSLTGYASSDGSTGNEAIYVNVGSGTLTINVASGAATPSIRTAGATVTVVSGQATITVTTKNQETLAVIEGAAVTVRAAAGGPFPFEASVTITRVTTTATVAHTGHPYVVGDKVEIEGADQNEYNRIKTITAILTNSYDFTVEDSPDTPATGTIKSTAVLIDGRTNASGVISDTRTYSTDQPISGSAKKGTHSPVFVPSPLTGTIDNSTGLSITALMIPDD